MKYLNASGLKAVPKITWFSGVGEKGAVVTDILYMA